MEIKNNLQCSVIQISLLIVASLLAWTLLHQSQHISEDVYPYLSSITPALVMQCKQENWLFPNINYDDLLAIHSTFPKDSAQPLIDQLMDNVSFSKLNWGTISRDEQKKVKRRRDILNHYQYFQPNKYIFPVRGTIWFEDSFGADREGGKRRHEGTDLFGKEGIPIVCIIGGKVEQMGWNRLGGERIGIRGDDGNYYYYAHFQYISQSLVKGKRVEAGELIGGMGHTGDALTTPDHLHLGIELPNGQWINPYPFLVIWKYLDNNNALPCP